MSNFREKAQAVKAAGEAERGNFTPSGVPKRMYDFWLQNTKSLNGRRVREGRRKENFCHFWRVVAIWAPLMFVTKTVERHERKIIAGVGVLLALGLVYTLLFVSNAWFVGLMVLLGVIGFAIALAGAFGGGSLALDDDDERRDKDMFEAKQAKWLALIGFPTAIIAYLGVKAVRVIGPWSKTHPKEAKYAGIATAVVAYLGINTLIGGVSGLVAGTLVLAGLLVVIALGIWVIAIGSDYVSGRRALAEQQKALYIEQNGPIPDKKPYVPSAFEKRLAAIFRGIGDFVVLIGQVVRVNKWKICPTVEIDTK